MGDTGAMVLGLVLASSSVSLTSQVDPALITTGGSGAAGTLTRLLPTLLPLLLPVAVVALPFTDLVLAVVRRVSAGRSPFSPDKKHLHHRLLQLGHSHRRAVGLLWFWAGVVSFGLLAVGLRGSRTVVAVVVAAVVSGIVATLAIPDRLRARRRRRSRLAGARAEPPADPVVAVASIDEPTPSDHLTAGRAGPPSGHLSGEALTTARRDP